MKKLKIAILSYRSAPFGGGQGVYVNDISRALSIMGHKVDVISGPPYPHLSDQVNLIKLPGLDLFQTFSFKERLKIFLNKIDIILLMSVTPGFGGQKFIPKTLEKLREARSIIDKSGLNIHLEIDGGVSSKNIREIASAGADTFVAGSAIYGADDYHLAINNMRSELEV